jgi:hypothetical protein
MKSATADKAAEVAKAISRARWVFLPLGLCALAAVGAHAAADVVGGRVLWVVDHVDAFFDAIFSRWSVTAPLVDLVGLAQRTVFARAVALVWELAADWLIALPLLGYQERSPDEEVALARELLRKSARKPLLMVRPVTTLLAAVAGSCAVARLLQGSLQLTFHLSWLSHLAAFAALLAMLVLLVPRAALRSLEHGKGGVVPAAILAPLCLAAIAASPLLSFFR